MAQPKRWVRLTMTVPLEIAHDIEMICVDNRALEFTRTVVKHGGEDENGMLKARPTGRMLVTAIAQSRKTFTTAEINEEAVKAGLTKQAASVALHALQREGVTKRVAPMTYALATHKVKAIPKQRQNKRAKGPSVKKSPLAGRVIEPTGKPAAILEAVRKKQNGSGEGVPLDLIRETVGAKQGENISPAITSLIQRGFLKRVAEGRYRAGAK